MASFGSHIHANKTKRTVSRYYMRRRFKVTAFVTSRWNCSIYAHTQNMFVKTYEKKNPATGKWVFIRRSVQEPTHAAI